jgi:phosphopantothenoylcysteine synthetase/decarboxylase
MDRTAMMKVRVANDSPRGKVLRVHGGTVEIRSGEMVDELEIVALTAEEINRYKHEHRLIITPAKAKAPKPRPGPSRAELEKAVADAEAALAAAKEGADLGAVAAAEQALDEAKRALAA